MKKDRIKVRFMAQQSDSQKSKTSKKPSSLPRNVGDFVPLDVVDGIKKKEKEVLSPFDRIDRFNEESQSTLPTLEVTKASELPNTAGTYLTSRSSKQPCFQYKEVFQTLQQ